MSKQERQQLTGHPSSFLLLYSESGAEIYLGCRPHCPPRRSPHHQSYPVISPRAGLGVWPLLPLAIGRAGPPQRLLTLQAAQALHVQVKRLIGTEDGLENIIIGRE